VTSERYYTYGAQSAAYRGGQPPRRSPAGARTMHRVQTGVSQGDARGQAMRGRQAGVSAAQRRSGGPKRPQDGRRQPARRSRRIPAKARLALFALVTLLVVFGVVKLIGAIRTGAEERFVQNVYINGVCMTGYTKDEGYKLIHELRDNWLNSTYTLTFQDKSWSFSPSSVDASLEFDTELDRAWNLGHMGDRATRREIVRNLEQVPAEFVSQPTFDEKALDRFVESVADDVHVEPVDAEVTLTELKPVITRVSVNGWELDKDKLKENLVSLIETGKADLQLPVNEVQPVVMSDNMEMKVIAKVETDVTFRGYPSRTNVRLALEHFNLMSVYPGETISFNEVVGPRTEAISHSSAVACSSLSSFLPTYSLHEFLQTVRDDREAAGPCDEVQRVPLDLRRVLAFDLCLAGEEPAADASDDVGDPDALNAVGVDLDGPDPGRGAAVVHDPVRHLSALPLCHVSPP